MKKTKGHTRKLLVFYDIIIFCLVEGLLLCLYRGNGALGTIGIVEHGLVALVAIMGSRFAFRIYNDILRYGGVQTYIKLMLTDAVAFIAYYLVAHLLPIQQITFDKMLAISCLNLLGALCIRMLYRYCFKCSTPDTAYGRFLGKVLKFFSGIEVRKESEHRAVKVAIFGAGDLGNSLCTDILVNKQFPYEVRCFIDEDHNKVGRQLCKINVISWDEAGAQTLLQDYGIDEVIVAVNHLKTEKLSQIYARYRAAGIKVKTYNVLENTSLADGKRQLKEVQIEDLLFRKPIVINSEQTKAYYKDKVILITGGGGSIGSELCRQIASFGPKTLIVLDIYENCAYDLQMELKMKYGSQRPQSSQGQLSQQGQQSSQSALSAQGQLSSLSQQGQLTGNKLDFHVEICSITNKEALRRVFEKYHPQIIINAAAHKHVPLMEDNPQEAIENNIFGCKNLLELTEEYNAQRFMMVSTDKAVNPTNVMGATKRMCEMMVLSQAQSGKAIYSCTRFGNVLGSAGSVIPLFKRQIANGGPVTLTDRRITRYFMTIPEASQLVLESGAMAHNGELFVLDMGQPVKIVDLAQNMIRLSGAQGVEIVETGLRPGEKLYEELLIKSETLTKTDNNLIFIEKDEPLTAQEITAKLSQLEAAVFGAQKSAEDVKAVLRQVVPTYRKPEEVNKDVAK